MNISTKCRAKNPATCTDPNCPEKKARFAEFYGLPNNGLAAMKAVNKMAGGASQLGEGEKEGYNLIFDLVDEIRYENISKEELIEKAKTFYHNNKDISLSGYKAGMRKAIKVLKQS